MGSIVMPGGQWFLSISIPVTLSSPLMPTKVGIQSIKEVALRAVL